MNFLNKNLKWFLLGAFVLLNVFIVAESAISGPNSGEQSGWFTDVAADAVNFFKPQTITDTNVEAFGGFIRKFFGHFLLFFADGLLGFFTFHLLLSKKSWYIKLAAAFSCGLFISVLSELVQLLTPERAGRLSDIGIDLLGYVSPLLIGHLILLIVSSRKKKKIVENE